MKLITDKKIIISHFFIIPVMIFFLLIPGCTTYKTEYYSAEDANTLLLFSFAMTDSRCGTGHNMIPVFAEVEKNAVDLCAAKILTLDCLTWSSINSVPVECTLILTRFK